MAVRDFKIKNQTEDFYNIAEFDGLNTYKSSHSIEKNQCQDALNVLINKELEKRGGYTEVTDATGIAGSSGVLNMYPYYFNNGGTRKLMYHSHTVCGEINVGTGACTNRKTGLTTNLKTRAITYNNLYIYTNGTDIPQKIDDTTAADLGGSPPTAKFIVLHKNYVFLAGNATYPSRLYWSGIENPETWSALDFVDVNPDDGDVITGLEVTLDSLIIYKEYNIYILYGDTPTFTEGLTLWRIKAASASMGTVAQGSIQTYSRNILFLTRGNGFHVFGGSIGQENVELDSVTSQLVSTDISPSLANLNAARYNQVESTVFDYKYICSCPNLSSTTNNINWVYDFRKGQWIPWNIPANCFAKFRTSGDDSLYFGSTTEGKIYRYTPTTYNDDGVAINAYWKGKSINHGRPVNEKIARYFYVSLNKSSDYTLTVTPEFDFGDTVPQVAVYSIGAISSDSIWGTMIWGTNKWGEATTSKSSRQIMNDRYTYLNIEFSNNTINEKMSVRDFTLIFTTEGLR